MALAEAYDRIGINKVAPCCNSRNCLRALFMSVMKSTFIDIIEIGSYISCRGYLPNEVAYVGESAVRGPVHKKNL